MDTTTSQTSTSDIKITSLKGFGLEELLKGAFNHTKERFLSYFLAYLLSFLIGIGAFLALLVVIALNAFVFALLKSMIVTSLLGLVSTIGVILGLIYIGSWTTLALANTIVSQKKIGAVESFKAVKPLVWKYYFVMLLTSIFMFGLIPWGIMSIFVLFILWSIWGSLTLFVFLDKQESGLRNLFISKAMVQSRFWGVLLRFAIVYLAYYLVVYSLSFAQGKEGSPVLGVLTFGISIFAQPFIMSYLYEIYKNLSYPTKVGSNMVWKVLSVIGWVVMFATLVIGIVAAVRKGPQLIEDLNRSKSLEKQMQRDVPGTDTKNENFDQEMNQLFKDLNVTGTTGRQGSL